MPEYDDEVLYPGIDDALKREANKVKGAIKDTYIHKQRTQEQLDNPEPTKSMKKVGISNARKAITEVMGKDVYTLTDKLRTGTTEKKGL